LINRYTDIIWWYSHSHNEYIVSKNEKHEDIDLQNTEMAECELRQRKKEDNGEVNLQEDKETIKSADPNQVQTQNKPEPVRFISI